MKNTTDTTKIHYVYRITNTKTGLHYYGSRSTKKAPLEDLGISYFSTFSKDWFKKDQKENPQDYKYKIIKEFNTSRDDANNFESKLHLKFNVSVHPKFINLANQLPNGFSTHGRVNVVDIRDGSTKAVLKEEYKKYDYYKSFCKDMLSVTDVTTNEKKYVSVEEFNENINYQHHTKNKVAAIDTRSNIHTQVSKEDFNKFDYYIGFNTGMVTVRDIRDNTNKNVTTEEYNTHEFYISSTKNSVVVIDKRDGIIKRVSRDDYKKFDFYASNACGTVKVVDKRDGITKSISKKNFDKFDYYVSVHKGQCTVIDTRDNSTKNVTKEELHKHDYYVNINSKKILVFNEKDSIIFEAYGCFKQLCDDNNLPYGPLQYSYKNNGSKIYQSLSNRGLKQIQNSGKDKCIGWYAKISK